MELFDKDTLTSVIFCAALMSAIDGDIDQEEWVVIKRFIKHRWIAEFGDFKSVQREIVTQVKELLKERSEMKGKLDQLVKQLGSQLTTKQKEVLLDLAQEVMLADKKISPLEEELLDELVKILGIRTK
ncbi:MAG: hypothetical protein GY866_28065 [Proteobacteria bacterium]|nr:hypothetical protein [Pseudomonadota bacterium]